MTATCAHCGKTAAIPEGQALPEGWVQDWKDRIVCEEFYAAGYRFPAVRRIVERRHE